MSNYDYLQNMFIAKRAEERQAIRTTMAKLRSCMIKGSIYAADVFDSVLTYVEEQVTVARNRLEKAQDQLDDAAKRDKQMAKAVRKARNEKTVEKDALLDILNEMSDEQIMTMSKRSRKISDYRQIIALADSVALQSVRLEKMLTRLQYDVDIVEEVLKNQGVPDAQVLDATSREQILSATKIEVTPLRQAQLITRRSNNTSLEI